MSGTGWEVGRWWRVLLADGSLWCETSDESEARRLMKSTTGAKLQRLHRRVQEEWRDSP